MPYTVRHASAALLVVTAAACSSSDSVTNPVAPGFLGGTATEHQIGVVVNSTGKALTLFQLGSPATQQTIAFGTSTALTPVSFSLRGRRAAVPLGNAASVALVDLVGGAVTRYFTFASGNATGSAWFDDNTVIAANTNTSVVGRFRVDQTGDAITTTVNVALSPTSVVVTGNRAFVVSANDAGRFPFLNNGVVTAIDPSNMTVIGTVSTGGTNPTSAAVGPDGKLYVVNTGDYKNPGSLTIINPSTLAAEATITGMGVGPGGIAIDGNGLAYISGFYFGTIVWNTATRQFVRSPSSPVCAPAVAATGGCRGASGAAVASDGTVYQSFFGSAKQGLAPQVFVYQAGTYALKDSIAVGAGPGAIDVRTF